MSNKTICNDNSFITPQRRQYSNRFVFDESSYYRSTAVYLNMIELNNEPKRKLSATKANAAFKSPLPNESVVSKTDRNEECFLTDHEKAVDSELLELEQMGCCEHELQAHIDLLHEYNEVKDTAQRLIGLLAVHKGITTRELYPSFGLDIND